jgi:hypothetical protein
MNAFWSGFFGQFRDCGRNAGWFLFAFGGLFIGMLFVAWAMDNGRGDIVVGCLALMTLVAICFLIAAIRRGLRERRHRLKFPGLSEDELKKARAKLAQQRGKQTRTLPVSPAKLRTRPPVGEVY